MQRYGQTSASTYGLIDNLSYKLDGNRLSRVDDAATASAFGDSFEFKDAVQQENEYAYDANGNLTKDLNRGIAEIQYNFLHLPVGRYLVDRLDVANGNSDNFMLGTML